MKTGFKNLYPVKHPLLLRDITLLRNKSTSPEYFREAVRRISGIMAVEITRSLKTDIIRVETPLEKTKGFVLNQEVIIIPVLRAGLSMVPGFLDLIPNVKVGLIGLERNEETLEPSEYYFKIPVITESSCVILLDPMLATGGSANEALRYLKERGAKQLVFACMVAAPEGIKKIVKNHPGVKIYFGALDRGLNKKGYILPGLGDAGDRAFGTF